MAVNFENSFKKGLEAAEAASRTNLEIDSVFKELNEQIQSATSGRIGIELKRRRDSMAALSHFITAKGSPDIKPNTYIVAVNKLAGGKEEDLAQFERASAGYPCHLSYEDQEVYCNDKLALEKHLSTMLSNVDIGKQLARLLSLPVISSSGTSDEE
jgi:hypothetical protein